MTGTRLRCDPIVCGVEKQVPDCEVEEKNEPFCLLMMDIDDFKKINDNHGHDCGDEVLKLVSSIVSGSVRSEDRVFRWGGEEILVIMRTDKDSSVRIAERIRSEIEKQYIMYRDEAPVSVTVTIGVTAFEQGHSLKEMMDDVDEKLYYGKRNGKNRVVSCAV